MLGRYGYHPHPITNNRTKCVQGKSERQCKNWLSQRLLHTVNTLSNVQYVLYVDNTCECMTNMYVSYRSTIEWSHVYYDGYLIIKLRVVLHSTETGCWQSESIDDCHAVAISVIIVQLTYSRQPGVNNVEWIKVCVDEFGKSENNN